MQRAETIASHLQQKQNDPTIVVVGACFIDYVAYVDHMPQIGETMHSKQFQKGFGGKAANQATAAGRIGGNVGMVGIVGADQDGTNYKAELKKNGVNTTCVYTHPTEATGLAMIVVDTNSSNNEIIICPNATNSLTAEYLRKQTNNYSAFLTKSCRFLVVQNENPLSCTLDVLREAHKRGVFTVFNSAPAPTPQEVTEIKPYLKYVSLFCPNEVEAEMLTGVKVSNLESGKKAVEKLRSWGVKNTVITLGAAGFLVAAEGADVILEAGKRVKAVDTTGAGDCFVGTMLHYLESGKTLLEACRMANVCAAISVQRKGTQMSYPTPQEIANVTF